MKVTGRRRDRKMCCPCPRRTVAYRAAPWPMTVSRQDEAWQEAALHGPGAYAPERGSTGGDSPPAPISCVSLVRVIQHGHAVAQFFADGGDHGLVVRAGEADGVALADAGGQGNGFGAAIHQHPGAGHGPLAGTAAAGDEADDLAGAQFLESALSLDSVVKLCLPTKICI